MSKLTDTARDQIIKLILSGEPVSVIAKKFKITTSGVYYIKKHNMPKEVANSNTETVEIESQSTETEEIDFKAWMEFWKEKYLEAHALLIQHQII